jgi:hypothetical protein
LYRAIVRRRNDDARAAPSVVRRIHTEGEGGRGGARTMMQMTMPICGDGRRSPPSYPSSFFAALEIPPPSTTLTSIDIDIDRYRHQSTSIDIDQHRQRHRHSHHRPPLPVVAFAAVRSRRRSTTSTSRTMREGGGRRHRDDKCDVVHNLLLLPPCPLRRRFFEVFLGRVK